MSFQCSQSDIACGTRALSKRMLLSRRAQPQQSCRSSADWVILCRPVWRQDRGCQAYNTEQDDEIDNAAYNARTTPIFQPRGRGAEPRLSASCSDRADYCQAPAAEDGNPKP